MDIPPIFPHNCRMDATVSPVWVALFPLLLGVGAGFSWLWNRARSNNAPAPIIPDVETLTEAVRLQGVRIREHAERIGSLEAGQARRDAELADALDRFAKMTQRLAVRADRAAAAVTEKPDETPGVLTMRKQLGR